MSCEVITMRLILHRDEDGILVAEIPEIGLVTQADPSLGHKAQRANAIVMAFEAAAMLAEDDEAYTRNVFDRAAPSVLLEETKVTTPTAEVQRLTAVLQMIVDNCDLAGASHMQEFSNFGAPMLADNVKGVCQAALDGKSVAEINRE